MHFTGNQLVDYKSPLEIPIKNQPSLFVLHAEYDSLLKGFSCKRFQLGIKSDQSYEISKKSVMNVKQIIFYKNQLRVKYLGYINLNGMQHQVSLEQSEGGRLSNLKVNQINTQKEGNSIINLTNNYIQPEMIKNMLDSSTKMMADLEIKTHQDNENVGLSFNLKRIRDTNINKK